MKFRSYLIKESNDYLGERLGDILNSLHDLIENGPSMGARERVKNAEHIVNQIRQILRLSWQEKQKTFLPVLQTVGVAIMKGIDEKDDLLGIIQSASSEIEDILHKLGTPVNTLGTPADEKGEDQPDQIDNS